MDRKLVTMVIAFLALVAGIVLAGWCISSSTGPTVVETPGQYQQFIAKWPFPELTSHFPQTLPQNAAAVRMILDPGGLQDAARVELQLQLPQTQVDDLLRRHGLLPATNPATRPAVAPMIALQPDPSAVRQIRISSPQSKPTPLPADYRLTEFFSYAEDDAWTHGRLYGTAVNRSTRHIIYFAQAW